MISEDLTTMVHVRVSQSTKSWLESESAKQGLTMSEYIRDRLTPVLRQDEKEEKK